MKQQVKDYLSECNGNPSIYVGTYAKYNDGNLYGAWIDLTKCADVDEFLEVCKTLHDDEADPEFMFQDFECFPKSLYSESMCNEELEKLFEWVELDEDDREMVGEYWDEVDEHTDIQRIKDSCVYHGDFDDYAYDAAEEMIACSNAPECVSRYFDYEAWGRDLAFDYHVTSNYVFTL